MKNRVAVTAKPLLLILTLTVLGFGQDAKTAAAESDFLRFDGNQSGWLSGRELIACQCKSYDTDGDNEVTKAEFFAGRGVALPTNKAKAPGGNTFNVGDRIEADPLFLDNWRKGRVAKVTVTEPSGIIVYEIKFDSGENMIVRADSNAMRHIAGGEIDERAVATSMPELSVTVRQVYDDYHNNPVAAKRKYVGKVVKVTGKIWIIRYSDIIRSYVDLSATDLGSNVTCIVEDKEQLAVVNRGETISIVGTVSGAVGGSDSVVIDPCKIEPAGAATKAANIQKAPEQPKNDPRPVAGGLVGTWYYITLFGSDGTVTELNNRQSFLWLKADGTYENNFGGYGEIGTYRVNGTALTISPENKTAKTYTISFGEDGKRKFGLGGKTLTLASRNGGYKLER